MLLNHVLKSSALLLDSENVVATLIHIGFFVHTDCTVDQAPCYTQKDTGVNKIKD